MNRDKQNIEFISALKYTDFREYLTRNDWEESEDDNTKWAVFSPVNSPELELIVPKDKNLLDYSRLLKEALYVLTLYYDQDVDTLASSILNWDRDVIKIIANPNETFGLPLQEVSTFLEALKRLLFASAKAESNSKPFFSKTPAKYNKELGCFSFGHTFKGSFGFSVFSAHYQQIIRQTEKEKSIIAPIERRAIERIMIGLSNISSYLSGETESSLSELYLTGMNSNMFEQLSVLQESVSSEAVGFKFQLSPIYEINELVPEEKSYSLPRDSRGIIKKAAQDLREEVDTSEVRVTGLITTLHSEQRPLANEDEDSSDRIVSISAAIKGHGRKNIKVILSKDDYAKALHAHEQGYEASVKGKLVKKGKYNFIEDFEKFTVLKK